MLFFFESEVKPFFSFWDFSKAFYTICHDILFKKKSGIRANYLNIFQSYLSNGTHYIEIKEVKSQSSLITCGVPQWSVLAINYF